MNDSEIIVALTRENMELKAEIVERKTCFDNCERSRESLEDALTMIGKAVDYNGHHMNLARMIQDRENGFDLIG